MIAKHVQSLPATSERRGSMDHIPLALRANAHPLPTPDELREFLSLIPQAIRAANVDDFDSTALRALARWGWPPGVERLPLNSFWTYIDWPAGLEPWPQDVVTWFSTAMSAAQTIRTMGKLNCNRGSVLEAIENLGKAESVLANVLGVAAKPDRQQAGNSVQLDDDATLSPKKLAEKWGILPLFERTRSRLKRWRRDNPAGNGTAWIEVADAKPREAKYLYRAGSVRHVLDEVKATSERPAKIISPG